MIDQKSGEEPIDPIFTYNLVCMKDQSQLNIEISREIDYIPKCLKCNGNMTFRYSIDNNGEIWMNDAILRD